MKTFKLSDKEQTLLEKYQTKSGKLYDENKNFPKWFAVLLIIIIEEHGLEFNKETEEISVNNKTHEVTISLKEK